MKHVVDVSFEAFSQAKLAAINAPPAEPPRKVASLRKARTRTYAEKSDPHERIASFTAHREEHGQQVVEVGEGMDSGRNMMAIFEDSGEKPRLKYNLRIKKGRDSLVWPGWQDHTEVNVPAGTTLEDMCRFYPLHVWCDALRIFHAEGWTAEQIWNYLPENARNNSTARGRPWNYIQAAIGREADKMNEEAGNGKRIPQKRISEKSVPEKTQTTSKRKRASSHLEAANETASAATSNFDRMTPASSQFTPRAKPSQLVDTFESVHHTHMAHPQAL